MRMAIITLCILCASCGLSPEAMQSQASRSSDTYVLNAHYRHRPSNTSGEVLRAAHATAYQIAEQEALKRKLVRKSKLPQIRRGVVSIGMTRNEVRMAWGSPRDINRTVGAYYQEQWVWGGISGYSSNIHYTKMRFVYFNANARVTTIQN